MKIAIGCDHAGYDLKQAVIRHLNGRNDTVDDVGAYSGATPSDYPVFANAVADAILRGESDMGILICGTGIGISIAANRRHGIHAALCADVFSAKACRSHNNANVLCLGARAIGEGHALEILDAFLATEFEGTEKRIGRIGMYD